MTGKGQTAEDRFPLLAPEALNPEQKAVHERHMTGRLERLPGPFNTMMRRPRMFETMHGLGNYIRHETSLPQHLNEFAILIAGRFWTAQYEWWAHHPRAIEAGMPESVLADLAAGRRPAGMAEDVAAVYDFCSELHENHAVSDAVFARAKAILGEGGVVDLLAASGFYTLVSMILNTALAPLPEGVEPPLKPLPRRGS